MICRTGYLHSRNHDNYPCGNFPNQGKESDRYEEAPVIMKIIYAIPELLKQQLVLDAVGLLFKAGRWRIFDAAPEGHVETKSDLTKGVAR